LQSGTSIGANCAEAGAGQRRRNFLSKMAIAKKAAVETHYWLRLLSASGITALDLVPLLDDMRKLMRIISRIVNTASDNIERGER